MASLAGVHRWSLILMQTALAFCAGGQVSAPGAAEQKVIVSRMRERALAYADRLQDFTCIQLISRSAGASPTGNRWKLLETQELELSYVGHRERRRLLKVNGESTDPEKRIKLGPYFTPSRAFGSGLREIFDPKGNPVFEWDHAETSPGGRVCVFRYRVPEASTTTEVTVNELRVKLGHRGIVYADCDTGSVVRFKSETARKKVTTHGRRVSVELRLDVRYAPTMIGSKEFLLPQTAMETALFNKTWTKAELQFQQYRKYDVNSTVQFDDTGRKPGR